MFKIMLCQKILDADKIRTHNLQIVSHFSVFDLFTIHADEFQLMLPLVRKNKTLEQYM